MKVLHYLSPGLATAGVSWLRIRNLEAHLADLAQGILCARAGSDVATQLLTDAGANPDELTAPACLHNGLKRYPVAAVTGYPFGFLNNFHNILERELPDIVHVHGLWHLDTLLAAYAAKQHGIRVVASTFGHAINGASGWPAVLERLAWTTAFAPMYSSAMAAFVAFDEERTRLVDANVNPKKIFCLHSYLDPENIPVRSSWQRHGNIVGLIDPNNPQRAEKIRTTLRSTLQSEGSRGLTLVCRGDRATAKKLAKQLAADNPIEYERVLAENDPDLDNALRDATCVATLCDGENVNSLLARALACATPIVAPATALHGLLQRINAGTPINDRSLSTLYKAIIELAHRPDNFREQLGRAGRKAMEDDCSGNSSARRLLEQYQFVLNK